MYSDKLVVAVKANGKILREHKDSVYVPFGTEYSLLIKNKNSVRALVSVEIDGTDVTEGVQLIVPANGSLDLERFIKNGNFDRGNRFKFIERTKKIEDGPRGIQAEDGLIRVQFEFERQPPAYVPPPAVYHPYSPWTKPDIWCKSPIVGNLYNSVGSTGTISDTLAHSGPTESATYSATSAVGSGVTRGLLSNTVTANAAATVQAQAMNMSYEAPKNDVGITVAGSESSQKFVTGAWFPTDGQKHVMILKLLGEVEGQVVKKPVTVQHKPTCVTCGTVNKANAKFCRECGTALTIL